MKQKNVMIVLLVMLITLFTPACVLAETKEKEYTEQETKLSEVIWEYGQERVDEKYLKYFDVMHINKVSIKPDDPDMEKIKYVAEVIYNEDREIDNFGIMEFPVIDYVFITGDYEFISKDDLEHYSIKKSHKIKNRNWKKTIHSYHLTNVRELIQQSYEDSLDDE